jgi:GT2 family glycosyltransferase
MANRLPMPRPAPVIRTVVSLKARKHPYDPTPPALAASPVQGLRLYNDGLSGPRVTVVVATLAADRAVLECLDALDRQSFRDFETVVVDNSACGRFRAMRPSGPIHLLEPPRNLGFGAAMNEGFRARPAQYLATVNDDAVPAAGWLAALVRTLDGDPRAGMCASKVLLAGGSVDSAGMLLCADGSAKQRGHLASAHSFDRVEEVLLPSGSAAMYRRELLDEAGMFDPDFFLYCEDTDLGLRGRWAGWKCLFAPDAVVEHRYSQSAGRASELKAYLVERNRIRVVIKTFPPHMLCKAPFVTIVRYAWHAVSILRGRGKAAEFREEGGSPLTLAWFVLKAHAAAILALPALLRERSRIVKNIPVAEFSAIARRHSISAREIAAL